MVPSNSSRTSNTLRHRLAFKQSALQYLATDEFDRLATLIGLAPAQPAAAFVIVMFTVAQKPALRAAFHYPYL